MARIGGRAAVLPLALVMTLSAGLAAHDAHVVGPYRLEIGWVDEPAFSGLRNAVVVEITDAASRKPVQDLGGSTLSAEVSFGSERVVLPLQRDLEHRHEFRAWILPTRPGTYTFHVTGKIGSQPIDISSTCSDKTFDCVVSAAGIQFPSRDPSSAELADRADRLLARSDRAVESAARAQSIAFAAVSLGALALVAAIGFGLRGRKEPQ